MEVLTGPRSKTICSNHPGKCILELRGSRKEDTHSLERITGSTASFHTEIAHPHTHSSKFMLHCTFNSKSGMWLMWSFYWVFVVKKPLRKWKGKTMQFPLGWGIGANFILRSKLCPKLSRSQASAITEVWRTWRLEHEQKMHPLNLCSGIVHTTWDM